MSRTLPLFAFLAVFCLSSTASAQVGGGGGDTGIDTGDIGGTAGQGLDPDQAFDQVERGATIGATAETGQGFSDLSVGNAGGGTQGGLGGIGGFGGGGGGLGVLGNLFGGFGGAGTAQSTQPLIRTRLRSAVAVPPTPPAMVQRAATVRFRSLANRPQLRGINVQMQGRTAVLTGVVPTAADRRMSELLMRLEPGVSAVQNQVSVAQ